MKVARSIQKFRAARAALPSPVGFVPTMGYLHEGHLSLVRLSREQDATTVASIFVNPTQFAATEDLTSYPRDLDRDLDLLEAEGVSLVLVPEDGEFYPPGYDTWVDVEALSTRLEGASRPGHFRGVTTVVSKLFHIMSPDRAYFGQKDAQQVVVIQRMVRDLSFGLEIVVGPTIREPDGLAMSSRNAYLSPEERAAAPVLRRALDAAEAAYATGERDGGRLRSVVSDVLANELLADPVYVSVADVDTLEELDMVTGSALVSMAVRFGTTRLIDNCILGAHAQA